MLNLTKKNVITLAIVTAIAIAIGFVLLPVAAFVSTVIFTLSAIAIVVAIINIVRLVKEARANRMRDEYAVRSTFPWRDVIRVVTLIGVIVIIIMLIKGCGNGSKVKNQVVENQTVINQTVQSAVVDELTVDSATITEAQIDNVVVDNVVVDNVVAEDVVVENLETTPAPETEAPETDAPETQAPETQAPETQAPETQAPETQAPETQAPVHTCKVAKTDTVPATCTKDGYINSVCSCGKVLATQTIKKTGHQWNEGKVSIEATENNAGMKLYTCLNCDETKTEKIAKLEHVCRVVNVVETKATCTEEGSVKGICSCGKVVETITKDATGHKWDKGAITIKPTEQRTGVKTYTCLNCDETKTEKLDKLDHKCKVDEDKTKEKEATCERDGYIREYCSCGELLDEEILEATGHDYERVSTKEPTATQDGYIKYECSECGDTYKKTIPATGEEETENVEVKLSATSRSISGNQTVTIRTTGDAKNLTLLQSMEQLNMKVINDTTVELSIKTPNVGGTVTVYDVTTGASIEITIEFIYD